MRHALSLLLALTIALAGLAPAAGAEARETRLTCPEEGFSTAVDFACTTEYVEGDGLYIKLSDDLMPYVLVSVDDSRTRVTDAQAYLEQRLAPDVQASYGQNGPVSTALHETGSIGGRAMPVLEVTYHNAQGLKIWLYMILDVRERCTVYYRVRYCREEDRVPTLSALDTIARNLTTDGEPLEGSAASEPLSFAVRDAVQGGMILGRCTAPADFTVACQATCSVREHSAGHPWLLGISALSPDGTVSMTYATARDFLADPREGKTPDGTYNQGYFTPMLRYMTAREHCDYWVQRAHPTGIESITLVEENDFPELRPFLSQREAELKSLSNAMVNRLGLVIDRVSFTIAYRRYRVVTADGLEFYFCVYTATRGMWHTASVPGPYIDITNRYILWDAPFVYTMFCPVYQWERYKDIFTPFVENTSATDQFFAADLRLSDELWDIITGRGPAYADAYGERTMREETEKGDDYDDERFTDYLFDQNDYTLSDGSHVKVPTDYDYVYEGDGGVVFYSDSAFSQPGGTTQLYPNR